MYKVALQNSKMAGEASKVRRYDRGLKVRPFICEKKNFEVEFSLKSSLLMNF